MIDKKKRKKKCATVIDEGGRRGLTTNAAHKPGKRVKDCGGRKGLRKVRRRHWTPMDPWRR